ncbi:30S ribosomal protein S6 [Aestuariispira insulae]|uniref:Small ribosomal subunit protein bS6 n=1 Tax=Aestuariispira insulae TaxID=1461337 RepID=A0A3D9HVU9_9PROT|nr:30S ribosomal protein S6 [Aestuariispira insulae]RED53560.1 SSU ribosomal protein S6P [Aestuariispira insulae]
MPNYETVLIARQDVSATQAETLADQFQGYLTAEGGEVARREYWGLRNLAYRIKKNRKGHYILLNYTAPASAVQEMERNMRLSDDVLRYMTVRTEELPSDASVVMQRKDERGGPRGDRGDRGDRGPRGPRPEKTEGGAE